MTRCARFGIADLGSSWCMSIWSSKNLGDAILVDAGPEARGGYSSGPSGRSCGSRGGLSSRQLVVARGDVLVAGKPQSLQKVFYNRSKLPRVEASVFRMK
jgi:hypothetical protein